MDPKTLAREYVDLFNENMMNEFIIDSLYAIDSPALCIDFVQANKKKVEKKMNELMTKLRQFPMFGFGISREHPDREEFNSYVQYFKISDILQGKVVERFDPSTQETIETIPLVSISNSMKEFLGNKICYCVEKDGKFITTRAFLIQEIYSYIKSVGILVIETHRQTPSGKSVGDKSFKPDEKLGKLIGNQDFMRFGSIFRIVSQHATKY